MNLRRIRTVAMRDFWAIVKTPSFVLGILLFLGLICVAPLMLVLLSLRAPVTLRVIDLDGRLGETITATLNRSIIPSQEDIMAMLSGQRPRLTGMKSELVQPPAGATKDELRAWLQTHTRDLLRRKVDGLVFIQTGKTEPEFILRLTTLADQTIFQSVQQAAQTEVRKLRAQQRGVDWQTLREIEEPIGFQLQESRAGNNRQISLREFTVNFVMPLFLVLGLFSLVSFQAERLLTLLIEERNKRLLEWLMVRLSPVELLTGKVLGALALGGILFSVVFGCILGLAWLIQYPQILQPQNALAYFGFYLTGFLLYGALYATVGAVCQSMKEAENFALPIRLSLLLPLIATLHVSSAPYSAISVTLSFFPLTAPFLMINRMVSTEITWWEPILALLTTFLAAVYALRVAARVLEIQAQGACGRTPLQILFSCLLLRP